MGHEGPGYNLDLLLDGKHIAEVCDEGGGGSPIVTYFDKEGAKIVEAYVKSLNLPLGFESFIGDMVDNHKFATSLAKWCKTMICFRKPNDPKDAYYTIKAPFTSARCAALRVKHGADIIIYNETLGMPYEANTEAPAGVLTDLQALINDINVLVREQMPPLERSAAEVPLWRRMFEIQGRLGTGLRVGKMLRWQMPDGMASCLVKAIGPDVCDLIPLRLGPQLRSPAVTSTGRIMRELADEAAAVTDKEIAATLKTNGSKKAPKADVPG